MERGRPRPRIREWALWQTRDPLGEAGGINLFDYALSNPVNFVDPLGLSALHNLGNFAAGAVDGFLGLPLSSVLGGINNCSTAYQAGSWAGFGASFLTPGLGTARVALGGAALVGAVAAGALASKLAIRLLRRDPNRLVTVTSWASKGITPDLNPGRWVQLGKATRYNFLKTGLWGPKLNLSPLKLEWPRVPFKSVTRPVPASSLRWPSGWEKWKGILGQRQIKG